MRSEDGLVDVAVEKIEEARNRFDDIVIMWTGGKDSTLMLWFARQTLDEDESLDDVFDIVFVDHGLHFDETLEFCNSLSELWGFDFRTVRNEQVLDNIVDGEFLVDDLDERNTEELLVALGEDDVSSVPSSFAYDMDTVVCNHLLKTVPMKDLVRVDGADALMTGIRWDEHDSRSDESFFSEREEPEHMRVHPILHIEESELWSIIRGKEVPFHPLYGEGFRSIGSSQHTGKESDVPAWEQDLDGTEERGQRAQNKDEDIMERLRLLGYN